jgi:hypothetical protein
VLGFQWDNCGSGVAQAGAVGFEDEERSAGMCGRVVRDWAVGCLGLAPPR